MNPVEIGDAITDLAQQPFNAAEFPFQFLEAFGNKKTAIDRLRKGNTNSQTSPAPSSSAATSTSPPASPAPSATP